jgi:hypothetical protein
MYDANHKTMQNISKKTSTKNGAVIFHLLISTVVVGGGDQDQEPRLRFGH